VKTGPCFFRTVDEAVQLVRGSGLSPNDKGSASRAAYAAFPANRPHARLFYAWEVYYGNPNARQATLAAMAGQ
jgi:hypothetical protein